MTVPSDEHGNRPDAWSRAIMRRALKASLGTLDHNTGAPYASLVIVGSDTGGAPVTLLSTLANHTKNLSKDPRVSLLFDETGGEGELLEGARVSVSGIMEKTDNPDIRARFLNRHPSAAEYADFNDFDFYTLNVEGAHFVGGFGLINDISAQDLKTGISDASALLEAEKNIVEHMNEDHAGAVRLFATKLLGAPDGEWRFVSCDPEGCDLVLEETGLRLAFPQRVTTADEVREALVELTARARK